MEKRDYFLNAVTSTNYVRIENKQGVAFIPVYKNKNAIYNLAMQTEIEIDDMDEIPFPKTLENLEAFLGYIIDLNKNLLTIQESKVFLEKNNIKGLESLNQIIKRLQSEINSLTECYSKLSELWTTGKFAGMTYDGQRPDKYKTNIFNMIGVEDDIYAGKEIEDANNATYTNAQAARYLLIKKFMLGKKEFSAFDLANHEISEKMEKAYQKYITLENIDVLDNSNEK